MSDASSADLQSVEIEYVEGGRRLFVFFGGLAAGVSIPPFEFYRAAQIVNEHRIFIRDFAQVWYHCGLPGVSSDIPSTVSWLQRQIEALQPTEVVFVGNSMGGYAAMLFGALAGGVRTIAFSPQSFISPWRRCLAGDRRWPRQVRKTCRASLLRYRAWDLKPILSHRPVQIDLFAPQGHRLDRYHAERLGDIPGITLHLLPCDTHGLVRLLKEQGRLPALLAGS
ncbi:MAG: alpha/beta fold hydrolase [Spongiibacteraceae bacterium]|jgi:pimeloyl-ACP methyl ester carboxylesterase|nr:alpha/beta fold hydrolase [Spongiibacteraceae bacterium]